MFENSEKFLNMIGFSFIVICYTLNIKITQINKLQIISSSKYLITKKNNNNNENENENNENNENENIGINFEDLIQVHAATCNYKELSS